MILKPLSGLLPRWDNNPCGIPAPVGAWVMNEGSGGKIYDDSLNGNNAILTGVTWKNGSPYFDANTDKIEVSKSVLNNNEGTIFTIHKRTAGWGSYASIFNIETLANNSPREMILYLPDGHNLRFYPNFDQSSGDYWNFTSEVATFFPIGESVSIAAVWKNNSVLAGYRNGLLHGALTGDKSWTTGDYVNSEVLSIGKTAGASYAVRGYFDVFYAFNQVLTSSQIAYIHQHPYYAWEYPEIWEYYTAAAAGGVSPGPALMALMI